MAEKNSNLKESYNELDKLSADEQKRLEYFILDASFCIT